MGPKIWVIRRQALQKFQVELAVEKMQDPQRFLVELAEEICVKMNIFLTKSHI